MTFPVGAWEGKTLENNKENGEECTYGPATVC